jgi:hypothetical protein
MSQSQTGTGARGPMPQIDIETNHWDEFSAIENVVPPSAEFVTVK